MITADGGLTVPSGDTLLSNGTLTCSGAMNANGGLSVATGQSLKTDTLDSTATTTALSIGATIATATTNGITLGTNCLIKVKSPALTNTGATPSTQAATTTTLYGGIMFSKVNGTNYTIPANINREFFILITGSTITITMPAVSLHQTINIRVASTFSMNITAPLAGTMFYPKTGGSFTTTYSMPADSSQQFYCDGTDWWGF